MPKTANRASGTPQFKRYNGASCNFIGTAITGLTPDNTTIYSFTWTPPASILGVNGVGDRYKFSLEAFA